jgi:hypothetical protein
VAMKDRCPTSPTWKLYLLGSQEVDRAALLSHLLGCPLCRFLSAHLAEELRALSSVSLSIRRRVELYPVEEDLPATQLTPLMAAKGRRDATSNTESLTLANDQRDIMLKAIRDPYTRDLWLYLLADDPTLCRQVLVTPFGGETAFVTDDRGRINLGQVDWPARERWSADVRLPRAVFTLTPQDFGAAASAPAVLKSPDGDEILVRLVESGTGRRLEIEFLRFSAMTPAGNMRLAVRLSDRSEIMMLPSTVGHTVALDHVTASASGLEVLLFE